jgi:predicted house-cleaning noncanonical NTP pyrophosphatase (MazG superfamily)
MDLRNYFASDEEYREFLNNVTPEELAEARNREFTEARNQMLDGVVKESKTAPSSIKQEISDKLLELSNRTLTLTLDELAMCVEADFVWEDDCADDIRLESLRSITPAPFANQHEEKLISIIREINDNDTALGDTIEDHIAKSPEFKRYHQEVVDLVEKIAKLSDEYPGEDFWSC